MIGFSAGGVVTSEALFGPPATRPDFAAIIYGVGEIREVPAPRRPCSSRSRPTTRWRPAGQSNCSQPGGRPKGSAELHIFQKGAHGFVNKGGGADHFMDRLQEWLGVNKLLTKAGN